MTFTLGSQVTDGDQGPFGLECRLTGPAAGPRLARLHQPRDVRRPPRRRGRRLRPRGPRRRPRRPRAHPRHRPAAPTHRRRHPRRGRHAGDLHLGTQDTRRPSSSSPAPPTTRHPDPAGRSPAARARSGSTAASPGRRFECTDNDQPVACTGGRWELPDPTRRTAPLLRPHHRRRRQRQRLVGADRVLRAAQPHPAARVGEGERPRLLPRRRDQGDPPRRAPRAAPRRRSASSGCSPPPAAATARCAIRVGRRDWHVVDLAGPKASMRQLVVIDRYSGMRTGRIVIESLSSEAGRPRRRRRAPQPVPRRQPQQPTLTAARWTQHGPPPPGGSGP